MSTSHNTLTNSRFPTLRGALIAAIVLAVPFYSGSTSALGQAVNETTLLALGIISFSALYWSNRGRIDFSDAELTSIVFFFAAVISAAFAVFRVDAWNTVGTMILLGLGYRAAASESNKWAGFSRIFAVALVGSCLLQTAIAIHQYFFSEWYAQVLPEFYKQNILSNMRGGVVRTVGGFINANYFAAFLNIGIAIALAYALFAALKLWQRALFSTTAAVLLVGVVLSGSKGALLVSAAIIATLAVIKDRRFLWFVLAVLILVVLVPNPVRDSVVRGITADRFVQMRPAIWNASAEMFFDNPIIGVGPANFNFVSYLYAPPTDFQLVKYSRIPGIAHNALLHALAEFGLLGGLPLILLVGAVIWLCVRALALQHKQIDPPLAMGIAAGILGVFLHSLVDNVANNRAILTTLMFAVPVLASLGAPAFFARRRILRIPSKRSAVVAVAVMLLFAGFYAAQVIKPLAYESRISTLQKGLDEQITVLSQRTSEDHKPAAVASIRGYLDDFKELQKHYPDNPAVSRSLGNGYRTLFTALGNFADFLEADKAYKQAAECLKNQSRLDHYSRLLLRFDLTRWGFPKTKDILDSMERLAAEMTAKWPNRAAFLQIAATVSKERGDYATAIKRLERAIELEPNFLQAIADLIRLADATEDRALQQRGEELLAEALQRISDGPPAEVTDDYAQMILASPR